MMKNPTNKENTLLQKHKKVINVCKKKVLEIYDYF